MPANSSSRVDRGWMVGLFLLALVVRVWLASAVTFPPLDDPAFYLTTARNVAAGRGLMVDALWSYQSQPDAISHPSHEHWMPLPTLLMALSMTLFGPSLSSGQIPGLLLGAALAPLTYLIGRKAGLRPALAGTAGLLLVINGTIAYQSASTDSATIFAFLGASALFLAGEERWPALVGVLVGLGYLTRSDGILLAPAVVWLWWVQAPEKRIRLLGAAALGGFLTLLPWIIRNLKAFDTPLPGSAFSMIGLTNYMQIFAYPFNRPVASVSKLWGVRRQALLHNGRTFFLHTFAWGLFGIVPKSIDKRIRIFFYYFVILFVVTALLFPVPTLSGTFYHSLGAAMPGLALAAVITINDGLASLARRRSVQRSYIELALGALLVFAVAQLAMIRPAITTRHTAEREQFADIASWLEKNLASDTPVMTTQPYTLNWVTERSTIVLPPNDAPLAASQAARRYGVQYLIITQIWQDYPAVLNTSNDWQLVTDLGASQVYELIQP